MTTEIQWLTFGLPREGHHDQLGHDFVSSSTWSFLQDAISQAFYCKHIMQVIKNLKNEIFYFDKLSFIKQFYKDRCC